MAGVGRATTRMMAGTNEAARWPQGAQLRTRVDGCRIAPEWR